MKPFTKLCFSIAASCLCLFITTAFAGNVYEIESKDIGTLETSTTEIIVDDPHLKMAIVSEDNNADGDMIFTSNPRQVVVLDALNQEYFVMDDALLEMIKTQFGGQREENIAGLENMNAMTKIAYEAAMAALDEQNLTAEERAQAEQVINDTFGIGSLPAAPSSEPVEILSQGTGTTNGYPVTVYLVMQGSITLQEVHVTDWANLEYGTEVQPTLESFFGFFADISQAFDEMGFGGNSLDSFAVMSQIGGFPVYGKTYENGQLDSEFSLRSASKRDLDPDAFEPPSGYKRQEMFSN